MKKKQEKWEQEYCKKFGLCEDDKCKCKEEIKFIKKLLKDNK